MYWVWWNQRKEPLTWSWGNVCVSGNILWFHCNGYLYPLLVPLARLPIISWKCISPLRIHSLLKMLYEMKYYLGNRKNFIHPVLINTKNIIISNMILFFHHFPCNQWFYHNYIFVKRLEWIGPWIFSFYNKLECGSVCEENNVKGLKSHILDNQA